MNMGEFNKAKLSEGSCIISVKKHKTTDILGPAQMALSYKLFGYLKVYVAEVRSAMRPNMMV